VLISRAGGGGTCVLCTEGEGVRAGQVCKPKAFSPPQDTDTRTREMCGSMALLSKGKGGHEIKFHFFFGIFSFLFCFDKQKMWKEPSLLQMYKDLFICL
jgi:hypothetical protein